MAPKSGSPSKQLRASDGGTPVRHCTRPPQHRSVVDNGLLLSILSSPSPPLKQQPRHLNTLPHLPVSTFCQPQPKAKAHHHHHHHHHFSQHFQPSPFSFSTSLAHILRFSALAFQLKHRKQENRELPRIPLLERVSNSSSSSNCTTTCSELEQHFQRKRRRRRHKLQKQLQYFPQPSLSSPPSPPSPTSAQSHSSAHSSAADSGDMPHRQACGDTTARAAAAVSHWRWWQTKVMLITVVLCLAAVSSSSCQRLPKQPPSKPPPHQQHQHSRSASSAADYYYSPTASATAALTLSSSSSSHSSFSPSSSSSSMLLSSSRSMMMAVAMKPPYEQQHQQAASSAAEIPLPRHQQQQQSRSSSSRMSSIPQHYRSAASSASSASVHHHKSQHQHQHQHQHQQQQQNFPQSSRLSSVEPGESLNEIDEEEKREREKEQTAAGEDPLLQLENSTPTSSPALNITAQVGHPVYLHCIVESLGDKMVSWIRLRDFHLLTIGSLTYIQDDRFAVRPATSHQGSSGSASNDWSLQIKHVTVRDEGLYECQINSDPPRSQYYYLRIVVPVSEIVGNPDIFVRSGAPINVTCLISSSPAPPAFVFWYHNNRMINYDYGGGNSGGGSGGQEGASGGTSGGSGGRGQISVAKDPNRADVVISRLLIRSAVLDDSGNYTCSPSNAEPASTYVHVLQGEKRLSNDIQNDDVWSQSEQLAANNEGHHSAAGAGAASAFSLLAPQYFRFYLFSTFTFTFTLSISMTTTTTAFAFLLLSVLNCTFYSRL